MSKIHGLARQDNIHLIESDHWECFCGRIFYSEKDFKDHVNTYG